MGATQVEHDQRLLAVAEVAIGKARELKYPVEEMDLALSLREEDNKLLALVSFYPRSTEDVLIPGGDLVVRVDVASGRVLSFERGQ